MGVLAEYLRTEADHLRTTRRERKAILDEWKHSLATLNPQLMRWVEAADAGLDLIRADGASVVVVEEPRIGAYRCPKVTISMGDSNDEWTPVVEVAPRARFVVAEITAPGRHPQQADGMVEVREGGRPTHYLFRLKNPVGDEWFICSVADWNNVRSKEHGRVEPLTADTFEAAVLSALK
jgi:hypothetical protein